MGIGSFKSWNFLGVINSETNVARVSTNFFPPFFRAYLTNKSKRKRVLLDQAIILNYNHIPCIKHLNPTSDPFNMFCRWSNIFFLLVYVCITALYKLLQWLGKFLPIDVRMSDTYSGAVSLAWKWMNIQPKL